MIRIPAPGRIENRIKWMAQRIPYLAATALLAAGLDGIENQLDPGVPKRGQTFTRSPEDEFAATVVLVPYQQRLAKP